MLSDFVRFESIACARRNPHSSARRRRIAVNLVPDVSRVNTPSRRVGRQLPSDTAPHSRRTETSAVLVRGQETSHEVQNFSHIYIPTTGWAFVISGNDAATGLYNS